MQPDKFRIDPFGSDIPYDWAKPSHKEAEFIDFVGFMEFKGLGYED